ncbi:MAG: ATP-binding protein [Bdellovibrionales bacterium]
MLLKSIFRRGDIWERGEVEVRLLPGIPNLHIVGLPDAHIKETGIKLKSALKACGFKWPKAQQIIVNLRPTYFRKSSAGVELAIALGYLGETDQISKEMVEACAHTPIYGEIGLDGRVHSPHDLSLALRAVPDAEVITGPVGEDLREGSWSEMKSLTDKEFTRRARFFDWDGFWKRPKTSKYDLHPTAARLLWLAAHAHLNVLVAGPQGSGKSTWARMLYGLSEPPIPDQFLAREEWISDVEPLRWRPLEAPHHSITPLAMIGGGSPIQAGVVTRAHGGVLLMDEFLQFHPSVLENLREPLETGSLEIARKGERKSLPAQFQLIGTTNLCPCGKLSPKYSGGCAFPILQCRSTLRRLSGPILDRFDMLIFADGWTETQDKIRFGEIVKTLTETRDFRLQRVLNPTQSEADLEELLRDVQRTPVSHRRTKSMMRVARALADRDFSTDIRRDHLQRALELTLAPIGTLDHLLQL